MVFSGILASLFAVNLGSSIDEVSASTEPDFLLGDFSSDLTEPDDLELANKTEQAMNLFKSMREQANGNHTKLSMLLLDEMEKRNIINNEEKQELQSFYTGFNKIEPTNNFTIIDREVSLLLDEVGTNTTNPTVASLKSTLSKIPHDVTGVLPW